MPSDSTEPSDSTDFDPPRPASSDLGWILLFVGVVAFSLAGLVGWVRL